MELNKKLKKLDIHTSEKELIMDVARTRNAPSCTELVRAVLHRYAVVTGKPEGDKDPGHKFDRIKEKKSRERTKDLCEAIAQVTEPKTLAILRAISIAQRKAARAARSK